MSTPADKKIKTWQRAGAVVLALSVWQAASWAVDSALLLPGPVTVLGRLCALAVTSTFRRAVAFSFCRIAGGFALALVLAFVLALAAGRWPVGHRRAAAAGHRRGGGVHRQDLSRDEGAPALPHRDGA